MSPEGKRRLSAEELQEISHPAIPYVDEHGLLLIGEGAPDMPALARLFQLLHEAEAQPQPAKRRGRFSPEQIAELRRIERDGIEKVRENLAREEREREERERATKKKRWRLF